MPGTIKGILLNTGKQFLSELLAGKHDNNSFGMYIEYCNSTPTAPALLATRDLSYYTGLTGNYGFVRVPFVTTAALGATQYTTMFSGIVLPDCATSGATLGSSSKFYSATLVYIADKAVGSKDVPIFVRNFYAGDTFSPVTNAANTNFTATINLALGE